MTAKTETAKKLTKAEIRANTIAMADRIQSTIGVVDGVTTVPLGTYYGEASTAGFEQEVVDGVNDFNLTYKAASVRAIGNHHLTMMQVDGDLTTVEGAAHVGAHVKVQVVTGKEKTYPGIDGRPDTIKYGVTTVTEIGSIKGSEMSAARRAISESAAELWAPKEA